MAADLRFIGHRHTRASVMPPAPAPGVKSGAAVRKLTEIMANRRLTAFFRCLLKLLSVMYIQGRKYTKFNMSPRVKARATEPTG